MNHTPLPVSIFFAVLYLICIFSIIKPDIFVNLTIKYFKLSLKLYGLELEGEIKPTDKANNIARFWSLFILVVITFLLFSGKFTTH